MVDNKIIIFDNKRIRRVLRKGEWFFSVVDVINALTDSVNPRKYWNKLFQRLKEEGSEVVTFCHRLKFISSDGKEYLTDCANKKGIFRIIQSIPSKKAEPFKLWLAQIGSERIDEIENPELAQKRAKEYYEIKRYPKDWIEKRMRGIAVRESLTDEWKNRGIEENAEFAILTDEISKATFGVSIKKHKEIKNLNSELKNLNLRDNMTDLELIFSMLGEASTTEIVRNRNISGFSDNFLAAADGGEIAGEARRKLEKKSGKKVVSSKNKDDLINSKDINIDGKEVIIENEK